MKIQVPGKVKMVVNEAYQDFESEVQKLVDDGYVPFSSMTDSGDRWSVLMMKTKMLEIDDKTGEPVK